MSHKVHPKIFRIKGIQDWLSQGFYGSKPLKDIKEDFIIRKFLTNKLKESSVERIEIEKYSNKINVVDYWKRRRRN
jgi:small subunit ribosomal protein S3